MSKSKKELCALGLEVQEENKSLKMVQTFIKSTMNSLEYLEKISFLSQQYERRTCVEITGIPADIPADQIENEVMKIYQAGDFKVHGKSLDLFDIQAANRKRKKSTVIVKSNKNAQYQNRSNSFCRNLLLLNLICTYFQMFDFYLIILLPSEFSRIQFLSKDNKTLTFKDVRSFHNFAFIVFFGISRRLNCFIKLSLRIPGLIHMKC